MEKPSFYIPSLDGFRTVAFSIVFLSHALDEWAKARNVSNPIPGGFGVTVFFFLSGYLITTLLRREHAKTGTISFGQFYKRRVIRIWPAFYVVLGLGVLATLTGLLEGTIQTTPLLAQIFHFANYYSIFHGNDGMPQGTGVYWSLAVEEHFYLIFPLLYLGLLRAGLRARGQVAVLVAICCAVLAWRYYLVSVLQVDAGNNHRTFYATDTRFDSILFGCILAILGNPVLDPQRGSERLWKFVLLPLGLLAIVGTFLYREPDGSGTFREIFRYSVQGVALIPVFVSAIRYPSWGPFVVLNWDWVRRMGVLTYPLYLVHFMVLYVVGIHLPKVNWALQGGIALAASFALALAVHHFVELPLVRLTRRRAPHLP
jgi:peptidoglycan/LPS O-acetylase OafA/YrhL